MTEDQPTISTQRELDELYAWWCATTPVAGDLAWAAHLEEHGCINSKIFHECFFWEDVAWLMVLIESGWDFALLRNPHFWPYGRIAFVLFVCQNDSPVPPDGHFKAFEQRLRRAIGDLTLTQTQIVDMLLDEAESLFFRP